jgi:hypothetical protein
MTARRSGLGGFLLSGLVVAMVLVAGPVAAQPARERSVGDRAAAYRTARASAGGFLLSPLTVTERLLARRPTVVLDIRGRSRYRTAHLRGARSVPLSAVLGGGRIGRVRHGTPVVVVDDDGTTAIEAMVVLRMAGVPAYAMTGGMNQLRRLLADPDALPDSSSVARRLPAARSLIVGTAAGRPAGGGAGRLLPLLAIAVLVLLIGAVAQVLRSRGQARRGRLAEAVSLIERDEPEELQRAVPLLEAALQGTLRSRERAEARFSLAFTLAKLGAYRLASETLNEPGPARGSAGKMRALDLWLNVKRGLDDQAIERYEEANGSADSDGVRRAMLVAYVRHGRRLVESGELEKGLESFRKAESLRRPGDPWHHHATDPGIAVGVMALLQGRLQEAQYRFRQVVQDGAQGDRSTLEARIGELLCDWRMRNDSTRHRASRPRLDDDLGSLIEEARAQQTDRQLLCGLLLWHAANRIRDWGDRPALDGLPLAECQELERRLDQVRALDPDLGDAHLLGGLVGWLFGEEGAERNRAFEALRTARALGVSVPEVLVLVGEAAEGPASPAGRFSPLAEDDPDHSIDGTAPVTVAELESRGRLAWRRAAALRSRLSDDERLSGLWREIDRLLAELEQTLRRLGDGAADLIQLERQLAVRTSELQLLDDQEAAG